MANKLKLGAVLARTPETLADAFEPQLYLKPTLNLNCDSLEEANGLARVLSERGWKVTVTKAIDLKTGKEYDAVRCSGKRRGKVKS